MPGTPDTRPQRADGEGRAAATAPRRAPTSAPRCPRPQAGLSAPPRGRQLGTGRRVAGQGRGAGGRSPLFLHRGAVLPFVALPEERVHRVPGRRRRRAPPALRCRREALSRDGGGRRGGGWGWRLERGWREAGRRLEAASCPPGAAGEGHGRGWPGAGPGGGPSPCHRGPLPLGASPASPEPPPKAAGRAPPAPSLSSWGVLQPLSIPVASAHALCRGQAAGGLGERGRGARPPPPSPPGHLPIDAAPASLPVRGWGWRLGLSTPSSAGCCGS